MPHLHPRLPPVARREQATQPLLCHRPAQAVRRRHQRGGGTNGWVQQQGALSVGATNESGGRRKRSYPRGTVAHVDLLSAGLGQGRIEGL